MKSWKKAAILSAICAGILVSPWIAAQIQNGQLPGNVPPPHEFTSTEIQALTNNARLMQNKGEVREDTATGLEIGAVLGEFGLRPDGSYTDWNAGAIATFTARDGVAPIHVKQNVVTFTGFEGGSVLDRSNAVIDEEHACMIVLADGYYCATVVQEV